MLSIVLFTALLLLFAGVLYTKGPITAFFSLMAPIIALSLFVGWVRSSFNT